MKRPIAVFAVLLLALLPAACTAQEADAPVIQSFFPVSGQQGTTVTTEVKGSNLTGASRMLVYQPGIHASVFADQSHVDTRNEPLWRAKCGNCHELRSPANRDMSPAQWAATVHRMIAKNQAPISPPDAQKIIEYLQSAAQGGKVSARITIAPNAKPGIYNLRVVTPRGISTEAKFEVDALPQVLAIPSSAKLLSQAVTLPCVVNGCITQSSELDRFRFAAVKGNRYVFDLKSFRYNDDTQLFFNPELTLYDQTGAQLAENHGYFELDPLIDWVCPASGNYVVEVRDLLGHSNPADVYHLAMGTLPYAGVMFPVAATVGSTVSSQVFSHNEGAVIPTVTVKVPQQPGIFHARTPQGSRPMMASAYPVVTDVQPPAVTMLPAGFTGRLAKPDQSDNFSFAGQGNWECRIYSSELGSPRPVTVTMKDANGHVFQVHQSGDRFTFGIPRPKMTYSMTISADGTSGERVYYVEIHPVVPLLRAFQRPDTALVFKGSSTVVRVRVLRRQGIGGPITVHAEGLPAGVQCSPVTVAPDQYSVPIVLTAGTDAPPAVKRFKLIASYVAGGKTVTVPLWAQQPKKMIFSTYYYNRPSAMVQIGEKAPFTARLLNPGPIKVRKHGGYRVHIAIDRTPGFDGTLSARIEGLPGAWVADAADVAPGQKEVTLIVRPDGGDTTQFMKRDKSWAAFHAVVELWAYSNPVVVADLPVVADASETQTASR